MESLKACKPGEYERMTQAEKTELAQLVDAQGDSDHQEILAELRRHYPMPTDYIQRVQHLQTLVQMAREIAMNDILVREQEPEPDADVHAGQWWVSG